MTRTDHEVIDLLLVEDNPSDVRLIEEAFRELQLPVDINVVTRGSAALDYLHQRGEYEWVPQPDIILLDLYLPGMSGWDVLETLRESSDVSTIPVIILTNSQAEDDMFESLDRQVLAYFTKPFDIDGYLELVRSIVDFLIEHDDAGFEPPDRF